MAALESFGIADLVVWAVFGLIIWFLHRLGSKPKRARRKPWAPTAWPETSRESVIDCNPGGPITDKQAQKLFEAVLQAAIRQKADAILIDAISGRPKVRLRLEGQFQELTGVGDADSYRRLVAQARRSAGLPAADDSSTGDRGYFLRLYRHGHLRDAGLRVENGDFSYAFQEISRRNRAVRFELESLRAPGGEALKISLQPEMPVEGTRFDLGFAAASERKYIEAVRSRSGIVLLTGPCNSGKSTATYRALALLRDQGRKIVTVEWPIEWMLPGTIQYWIRDGRNFDLRLRLCLRRAIDQRPDVLMVQNIDWIDDKDAMAAIDYAASGGLLITAIHIYDCAQALANTLRRYFSKRRLEAAEMFKIVVAPRQLFMVCMHCAEEFRVPAKTLAGAGMSDPPVAADGRVATWRGRGCPMCENSGKLGSTAVYEVLELTPEMRRFIENDNDWNWDQVDYLRRQAWQHGMRTQRELALERVLAGDISLQEALLSTRKPKWLTAAQATRRRLAGGEA